MWYVEGSNVEIFVLLQLDLDPINLTFSHIFCLLGGHCILVYQYEDAFTHRGSIIPKGFAVGREYITELLGITGGFRSRFHSLKPRFCATDHIWFQVFNRCC